MLCMGNLPGLLGYHLGHDSYRQSDNVSRILEGFYLGGESVPFGFPELVGEPGLW